MGALSDEAVRKSADFYALTRHAFHFLEDQYGYRIDRTGVDSPEDYRDATAEVLYLSAHMSVHVGWFFDGATIGVSFIEVPTPWRLPPTWNFIGTDPTAPRAIGLQTLAELRGQGTDADFLLGDPDDGRPRKVAARQQLIDTNLAGILAGLARAAQRYAAAILAGDSSEFPEVVRFYAKKSGIG